MVKYFIEVDERMAAILKGEANFRNVSAEDLITQILNRYLVLSHTINKDEMAEGYQEMSDINLELANL